MGWNDFLLRSYDPQLGRFLQHDPYDQFASGYVGMGDDPVNGVDPSGGFSGMTLGASMALGAFGGFIIGGAVGMMSGGDPLKSALIGAGVGIGAGALSNLKLGSLSVPFQFANRNEELRNLISFTGKALNIAKQVAPLDDVGYTQTPTLSYSRTKMAAKIAATLSAADGPIPFGEGAGIAIVVGAALWDTYDNIVAISNSKSTKSLDGNYVGIAEGLTVAAKFLEMAGRIVNPNDEHHSDPIMYGGDRNQRTTPMLRKLHRQLHKAMRDYLREINRKLLPGPGRKGDQIVELFGRKYILEQLSKFYKTPEAQKLFKEAANDFFKQHPNL